MKRRHFLASAAALATAPGLTGWAAVGAPDVITAANRPDKSTWLVGLQADGTLCFQLPLPGRGHGTTPHPTRAEVVGFARRPGRFAVVLDCVTGRERARIISPPGRHFYGHGAFSSDGNLLFATENNYDDLTGTIGIYDADRAYRRVGELPSGGLGPHEILRREEGGFVVANGGIQTHPDMPRARLNIPSMQSSLVYLDANGMLEEQVFLPENMQKNSIRHIDIATDGAVLMALQWQGNPLDDVPLVARHKRGEEITLLTHPEQGQLKNYAGSIACAPHDGGFAVTGPKGSVVIYFDAEGQPAGARSLGTASGVARSRAGGLIISCDGGLFHHGPLGDHFTPVAGEWAWDNHLIAV
ncbi:DUF1513 domain-containing protein [Aliiroseovarius crassostreae]|uniref:DUF1513 domain-containing protein n=1 Tax=Aliiroseovarius crassostreae TaxID=154981 RepID=UPI0022084699|nr:DUF1513 domain-containing protein [Aliiroseovarius crassostreae]UWQ02220.1 DUF1513 domain-containing protein [Aliiroseovarius crassostreae]